MADPEKDKNEKEPVLSEEEQAVIDHEKAVNEDPGGEPLEALAKQEEDDRKPEGEKEEESAVDEEDFDAEILSIAADLGISESKARSYSSVADLERALMEISSREEPKAEKKEEPEKKPEPEKIHIQGGEDLDEALVKQFNEALDKISGRNDEKTAALEKTIASMQSSMNANQAAQFVASFDTLLAKHGEAYAHELGEGATLELTGKHRANREKIVDEMSIIVASHQLRGRPIPSDTQLVQRAIKEVFGEREKGNGAAEKRRGQFLRRGSSRSSAAPSKRMRARQLLREKLAEATGGDE